MYNSYIFRCFDFNLIDKILIANMDYMDWNIYVIYLVSNNTFGPAKSIQKLIKCKLKLIFIMAYFLYVYRCCTYMIPIFIIFVHYTKDS